MSGNGWEKARAQVKKMRGKGYTDQQIRKIALDNGWTKEQVEKLFAAAAAPPPPPSPPPPRAGAANNSGNEWKKGLAYVKRLRRQRYTDQRIREKALERGWTQEQVEKLLPGRALREHGGSDEGGRRSVPKQGRVSSLLPLLVSVLVALAVGWFQARSFEGIPVWRNVDTTLPWWSWPAIPALALAVLCMFRPERRRQVWALIWGLAAGLLVGRLILPVGFGILIRAWPQSTDIATRIHLGHAWPVTAALMALVTVLAADSFAQLAAFSAAPRPARPLPPSPQSQPDARAGAESKAGMGSAAQRGGIARPGPKSGLGRGSCICGAIALAALALCFGAAQIFRGGGLGNAAWGVMGLLVIAMVVAALAALVGLVLGIAAMIQRATSGRSRPAAANNSGNEWEQARAYVRMLREKGHADEDIRQMALERGWTEEQVEELLPGRVPS